MVVVTFDSHILGGLPVEVVADVQSAEPDVGIFNNYATIEEIRWPGRYRKSDRRYVRGKAVPQSVWDRISEHEWESLAEEALGA